MFETCTVENVAIKTGVGMSAAAYGWLETAAITLHGEGPRSPDRACPEYAICNVEECMDRQRRCRKSLWVVLVVVAGGRFKS